MLELDIHRALNGFSLAFSLKADDGLIALFGPSGSGKTMTLDCIAGLVKPDSGRIAINGSVVFDSARGINLPPQRRKVGYVFQDYALLPHLSVEDNIAFGLNGLSKSKQRARVADMVRLAGLAGLERRRPRELSGGQQQRVAIARALAIEPSILLLDEPFTALDSGLRRRLQEELVQLIAPLNITTVLVTHNLREAYILSRDIAVLDAGSLLQMGPSSTVVTRPSVATVARLVGIDNVFRAVVAEATQDGLQLTKDGARFETAYYPYSPGTEVECCIPSRDVMLVAPTDGERMAHEPNYLVGRILQTVPHLGSHVLLFKVDGWDSTADYHLHIEVPPHMLHELSIDNQDRWVVYLNREAIHVMPAEGPPAGTEG